jgi:hypothetical protein
MKMSSRVYRGGVSSFFFLFFPWSIGHDTIMMKSGVWVFLSCLRMVAGLCNFSCYFFLFSGLVVSPFLE